ncbi:nuclear pore complex protein NUP62-like [Brachypodium distachyon]|uniref:nuclear pore complex protein NUP62-like n=1 Tax=Brachypodium distachyon TaxID=15368 RepID=UPI00071D1BF3|nr:nuclear pore complex protein NUP62-like [Brachypodium distachyon]|eukprot:XP_014751723.1 nuclear pore complex protein NUP62-like [Brachypodium distachyon]
MAAYQLRVAPLHPTSLFLLAAFQFLCEGFVGEPDEFIYAPTELPVSDDSGRDRYGRDAELLPIVERVKALQLAGLADLDVARTYISWRITPLQLRYRPAWMYIGPGENTRLQSAGSIPDAIRAWVKGITGEDAQFTDLLRGLHPSTSASRGCTTSDSTPAGAGKRGRTDTAPAAPSKKPRTRATASASQARTEASGAATTAAADLIPVEEEPAAGPIAPTTRAGDAAIDLTSDVENAGLRDKPEVVPVPSPAAPDTTVAAPTVATGAGPDSASPASQAGDTDPVAAPQEATPARSAVPPPDLQPSDAGVEKEVAGEWQAAPRQRDDAPPGQTVAAGVSSSSAATSSPDLSILAGATLDPITWDPSIYDQGHQFLDSIKEQQLAKDEAATPVVPEAELHRQLEDQRAEHQQALDSLATAWEKANKEHEEVLATTQARLNEKSELVSSYSTQLQALCTKLEEQAKATEDGAAASARREKELNSTKERSTHLESELSTAQGELIKMGEDNVAKAKEIARLAELVRKAKYAVALACGNHDKLAEQRRRETERLREIAQAVRELLPRFELLAVKVDGTDISTLIPFYSNMFCAWNACWRGAARMLWRCTHWR